MVPHVAYPKPAQWLGHCLKQLGRTGLTLLMVSLLSGLGLSGCQNQGQPRSLLTEAAKPVVVPTIKTTSPAPASSPPLSQSESTIQEVDPPESIQQLRQATAAVSPQLTIVQPKAGEILQETAVSVILDLKGLKIFQDSDLALGPHLRLLLDDRVAQDIYSLDPPLKLDELEPGTHTLRVFAVQPWGESFKTARAYAQATFHVLAPDGHHQPNPDLPLLTYNLPQGRYTAEPILLDFVLQNAPLHLVAQEKADDDLLDWRIRCTINGQSFVLDRWQSLYLKGFHPGNNWVKLEFLDESGEPIANTFNTTVSLVNYQPDAEPKNDPLGQLIQGELSLADLQRIIDPTGQTKIPSLPKRDQAEPSQPQPDLAKPDQPQTSPPELDQVEPDQSESSQPQIDRAKPDRPDPSLPDPRSVKAPKAELGQPEIPEAKPIEAETQPSHKQLLPTESDQEQTVQSETPTPDDRPHQPSTPTTIEQAPSSTDATAVPALEEPPLSHEPRSEVPSPEPETPLIATPETPNSQASQPEPSELLPDKSSQPKQLQSSAPLVQPEPEAKVE